MKQSLLNNSIVARSLCQIGGIDVQSFLLLKKGLKSVIRVGYLKYPKEVARKLKQLFQRIGIKILIGEFKNDFHGLKIKEPIRNIYFSLSFDLARKAYEAEKAGDRKTLGRLFSYPDCCVGDFIKNCHQENYDLTISALLKTRTRPSFYCNFIFNFESKLRGEEVKIYQKTTEVWRPTQHLFLIKHIPCSFDCKESVKLGKKTMEILEQENSDLAREIETALKRPVLYFDYFRWLVFDGEVKGNQLRYRQILPYPSLFSKEKIDLIKKGDRLIAREKEIVVLKGKKPVGKIKKDDKCRGVLIDFQ